jgi:hypothetical protein
MGGEVRPLAKCMVLENWAVVSGVPKPVTEQTRIRIASVQLGAYITSYGKTMDPRICDELP